MLNRWSYLNASYQRAFGLPREIGVVVHQFPPVGQEIATNIKAPLPLAAEPCTSLSPKLYAQSSEFFDRDILAQLLDCGRNKLFDSLVRLFDE